MSENTNSARDRGEESKDEPVSRRQVVKAIGAVGGAGMAGPFISGARANPGHPKSASKERVTGNELKRLIRKITRQEDVKNLMPSAIRQTVMTGNVVAKSRTDHQMTELKPGSTGAPSNRGSGVIVGAVRHSLDNGNVMLAVAYVTESVAIWFHRYGEMQNGRKTVAMRWDVSVGETVEDSSLSLQGTSTNGKLPKSPDQFTTTSGCSGCDPGPSGGGYMEDEKCTDLDVECAARSCVACGTCGTSVLCLLSCLGIYCPWVIATCCTNWETECVTCCGMYC